MKKNAIALTALMALSGCGVSKNTVTPGLPPFAQKTISLLGEGKVSELQALDFKYIDQIEAMKKTEPEFRWERLKEQLSQKFRLDSYSSLAELLPFDPEMRFLETRPIMIQNERTFRNDIKAQQIYVELKFQDSPELSPIIRKAQDGLSTMWHRELAFLKRRVLALTYTADRNLFVSSNALPDEDQSASPPSPYIMGVKFENQHIQILVAGEIKNLSGEVTLGEFRLPIEYTSGGLQAKWTKNYKFVFAKLIEQASASLEVRIERDGRILDELTCQGGDGTGGTYTQLFRYPTALTRPFGEEFLRNTRVAYDNRIPMKACTSHEAGSAPIRSAASSE